VFCFFFKVNKFLEHSQRIEKN